MKKNYQALVAGTVLVLAACGKTPSSSPAATSTLPGDAAPQFRDVTGGVGLDFQHFLGATGLYYFPETVSPGGALFDYDNDGDLDIYLLQGKVLEPDKSVADARFPAPATHFPGHRLFRNELTTAGKLHFVDVTTSAGVGNLGYGMGAITADYDNDGDADLYVTNYGANVLYRNDGDGSFTDVTAVAGVGDDRWNTSASFVDYDRDGDLDLFVAAYVSFNVKGNKRCSRPTTGERDYCSPQSFAPIPDRLFRNDGNGRFVDVTVAAGIAAAFGPGLGVTTADFNGDGWPDIYVANDGAANQLWLNRGNGTFADDALMSGTAFNAHGKAEASMGVTAGDVDGDGDEDLFMTHLAEETNTLYLNNGQGNFTDSTSRSLLSQPSLAHTGFGSEWFDFDNDGDLDLFVANGAVKTIETLDGDDYPYHETNQLLENLGDAHFADISASAGPAFEVSEVSRGAAFGDIDNDGDVDILVTNNNGPVRLLLNELDSAKHWLRVTLEGNDSNRDALTARIELRRPGQPPVWRRVHTDGSYLSASDKRVHFGLGEHPESLTLVVHWPSGLDESWSDVIADSELHLIEGTGKSVTPPSN